eukprot:m51a1_g3357 hypothetical protein (221) ;mRNA; f:433145-433868
MGWYSQALELFTVSPVDGKPWYTGRRGIAIFAVGVVLTVVTISLLELCVRKLASKAVKCLSGKILSGSFRVGVVGFSKQQFDESRAAEVLRDSFDRLERVAKAAGSPVDVVSGLTDCGVPALAYREAARRGFRTVGVAPACAQDERCWPCDEVVVVGRAFGDESEAFLSRIDALVCVGGGQQARREFEQFAGIKWRFDLSAPEWRTPVETSSGVEGKKDA